MIKVINGRILEVKGITIEFADSKGANEFMFDYISKYGQELDSKDNLSFIEDYELQTLVDTYGYIEIENLDLSIRSYNCLKRAGINLIMEVLQLDYERIIRVRNLGTRSIREIERVVNEFTRSNYINWSESLPPVAVE